MNLRYLGTAMIELRIGKVRLVTDPALDPAGTKYDFGPWYAPSSWFASEKLYDTPAVDGRFDAALVTHDQHGDNLDFGGRTLIADEQRVGRVITTVPGARRLARPRSEKDAPGKGLALGGRVEGLAAGATTRVGDLTITAMVARHGPSFVPQVHEVIGFLIDADDGPRVWISGDTVMFPALAKSLAELGAARPIDVAVVHCGAVGFPRAIGLGSRRFTFDATEAAEACKVVDARTIVPVHRSGWAHFQEPESEILPALDRVGLADRVRMLELGGTLDL